MRCERLDWAHHSGAEEVVAAVRALAPRRESVADAVGEIVATVRARGDAAVREHARRLDGFADADAPLSLTVEEAVGDPAELLGDPLWEALDVAERNVRAVAEASISPYAREVEVEGGRVTWREVPVAAAAIYVPGGRAPYVSTVVMGVVAARVAGVEHVVVCTPPGPEGAVNRDVLAACWRCGAHRVVRVGGAQAIAALAYGTESVRPVDLIAGPGNLYVQEAKRQVAADVGIDAFAGPSDLLVVAAADADPDLVALDLLAQAEHGPGAIVVAVSASSSLLDAVADRLARADTGGGAACALVDVPDALVAAEVADAFAPEHLELVGGEAEALAGAVRRAGCVFVGAASATAFGDYVAGSNHILPTGGAARFSSGLSAATFRRRVCEVRMDDDIDPDVVGAGARIARAEGFELHARSMEARLRDNGRP